ncbi:MAG TPA: hypothetical protein ENJ51_00390 [Leucothrix mucor]|uniref:Caspase family p20 domain-containing protein n=1 Tax=Leucothrix mucor TaxID=45248 RepID=A0A7V2T084_LEUMU|nr:hypothetical protein [Leucothrix mucor]
MSINPLSNNFLKKAPLSIALGGLLFTACGGGAKTVDLTTIEGANIDDLYIVDCLLPGRVRTLGRKLSYLAPRRVIKTSGSQCGLRGGEYVAYDRANYQTALKVWMPMAKGGDPKAQSYVGEIYEKGLGTQPNYQKAAVWYQKAANQRYSRAKMSLGSLYERGLGVPRSNVKALSLYRDASGLADRQVEFVTPAQRRARIAQTKDLQQTKVALQAALGRSGQLESDVKELQAEAKRIKNLPPKIVVETVYKTKFKTIYKTKTETVYKTNTVLAQDPKREAVIRQLSRELRKERAKKQKIERQVVRVQVPAQNTQLLRQLEQQKAEIAKKEKELAKLKRATTRRASTSVSPAKQKKQIQATLKRTIKKKKKELKRQEKKVARLRSVDKSSSSNSNLSGVNFGRYYALVIGNNNYSNFDNLKTAVNDAESVASVLRSQYGFKTSVLKNASKRKMLSAFNTFVKRLGSNDNLLIYYAGHGQLSGGGHWLPSNASKSNKKSWIPNAQLTNFIDAMKAKHVLVVADSCYSGTLSQSSIPRPILNSKRSRAWFDAVSTTKVRVVMSSGGIKPVLDSGSGRHSVFANAFLGALRSGNSVMEGAGLYQSLRQQVKTASSARGNRQNPVYAPIKFAGHQAGDFIFLKGGHVATLDKQPDPSKDDQNTQRFWALRELLFVFKA